LVAGERRLFVLDYYDPMTLSKRPSIPSLMLALALSVPAVWAQSTAPANSELNSSLMYELLLAEISAYNDDPVSAYQLMLDAAQKSRSDQLFERAVEIALRARAGDSALLAAQAWSRNDPANKDATRYVLQILIGLNRLHETVDPMKRSLAALAPKERSAAIAEIPRYFVRATDKTLAVAVVEQTLIPELASPVTGPAAYAAIGTMRALAENSAGALLAAQKGAALNRKAEEPVLLALALMDAKVPDAEALVLDHLKTSPRPEIHMAYIRKLLDAQRYADAEIQVKQLNAAVTDFAEAWLVRGSLALQAKKPLEAQTALSTFVQLRQAAIATSHGGPSSDRSLAQAYLLLAEIAEQDQKLDQAEQYLARVDSPQDALRVQARRGGILARQGKLEEGIALIRATSEIQPEDARGKVNAEAQLLREYKQFQRVYDFLQDALKDNPADADLRYDLAMAAEKVGKIDEMEALLRRVIAEKPDYYHAYNALGYSLADRKLRLPEARDLVQTALTFAPNDPFILDSLGWVEFRSGNLEQALQILQGAFQARPDAEIAAHLGEVMWSLGKQEQARAVWNSGLTQNPANDTLLDTIKRLSPL
jgi:tetratricopeptide (TPR) repeat protein